MAFMFKKLEASQKAVDFADEISGLTEGFPRGHAFTDPRRVGLTGRPVRQGLRIDLSRNSLKHQGFA